MRSLMVCTLHPILLGGIKYRRIRWAGYVACMGKWRGIYRILSGNLKDRALETARHT
jgi:hypothetical protein